MAVAVAAAAAEAEEVEEVPNMGQENGDDQDAEPGTSRLRPSVYIG